MSGTSTTTPSDLIIPSARDPYTIEMADRWMIEGLSMAENSILDNKKVGFNISPCNAAFQTYDALRHVKYLSQFLFLCIPYNTRFSPTASGMLDVEVLKPNLLIRTNLSLSTKKGSLSKNACFDRPPSSTNETYSDIEDIANAGITNAYLIAFDRTRR
ncbi:hypothetical protein RvY_06033 [Ramazzottius varieornatus]|uniref:Uncharacterized protein n=1 Tax=Ramazzottius varieornatus TaxID=947166 RepID=A0A1D1V0P2_RAMVA|nr:hypothetical protein RvY_06033 [Ramazzottius varieornatus]